MLGLKHISGGKIEFLSDLKKSQIGYLAQQTDVQKFFPASVNEVVLSGCLNKIGLKPFYGSSEKHRAEVALDTPWKIPIKKSPH